MKLSRILKAVLLEKKGDSYDSGCVMLDFTYDDDEMDEIHKMIDKDDLFTEEGDRSYGIEDEPHVTLLFGLEPKVTLNEIKSVVDKYTFYTGKLKDASLFKNEKFDVLKFDLDEGSLKCFTSINDELKKFPYKNDFPNYHPHCTIAYLKPGKGQKYVDELKGKELSIYPFHATYSEASGKKHKIEINVD